MGSIGKNSYSHTNLENNVTVGNYTSIAANCVFHNGWEHLCSENKKCVYTFNWEQPSAKPITIGSDVWIGHGVRMLDGVTIGDGAIVGAGSVVASDVPPFAVVVGNPARIVRLRFNMDQIGKLLKIKWWDWDIETIKERTQEMKDIDLFIKTYV